MTTDEEHIIEHTTITKDGCGVGYYYQFSISVDDAIGTEPDHIMAVCGYHPNGYGNPYDIKTENNILTFKCAGSCD